MSTRATYQFLAADGGFSPRTTFYIHYDGYPEGAAAYFADMRTARQGQPNYSAANAFFRGNPLARLARDHEAHGDTEYRYTYNEDQDVLVVEECPNDRWVINYRGPLAQFLALHVPAPA